MLEKYRGIPPENNSESPQKDDLLKASEYDFNFAIHTADSLTNRGMRNDLHLTIASEQVRAGIDPLFSPEYFLDLIDQSIPIHAEFPLEKIALMQAQLGNESGALNTADRVRNSSWLSFPGDLAITLATRGFDVQPLMTEMASKINPSGFHAVYNVGRLVETQVELGFSPDRVLLDRLSEHTSPHQDSQDSHNIVLAIAYAKGGFAGEALDTWTRISENYHLPNRVKTLAILAVEQARQGLDTTDVIANVQELTELIDTVDGFGAPASEKAEIYADLARTSFLSGNDPRPMIDTALTHALDEASNLRTNVYIEIARAQLDTGLDARDTLILAREWANDVVKPDEPEGSWGPAIQIVDWEEIFRVQLEGNYFTDARETLAQYDRYPDDEILAHVAGLHASLGRAQKLAADVL